MTELLLTADMEVNATLSRLCADRRRTNQQSRSTRAYHAAQTRGRHCLETDPIVREMGR